MVGKLKRYKRDPNRKGRGPGLYYHRGKGKYAKYSISRDKKRHARRKWRKRKYRHTGDKRGLRNRWV